MNLTQEIKEIESPQYYKHSSHATYNLTWHVVWITKYRRKTINEAMMRRLETIILWVCKEQYIHVIRLGFEKDHVHCLLSFPITTYIPDAIRYLKWRTSKVIRAEFEEHLSNFYKGRYKKHLWAVWYFFCSVWKVDMSTIENYVEQQWEWDSRGEEVILT